MISDAIRMCVELQMDQAMPMWEHTCKSWCKGVGLSHITPLKARLAWQAPRKTLGTSRRRSHITSIVFCNDSLRAPTNSANYRKCLK